MSTKPEGRAAEATADRNAVALTRHRGLATWGERLVPLGEFRDASSRSGRVLGDEERERERQRLRQPVGDGADAVELEGPLEGPWSRAIVFGGVYSNHRALEAVLDEAVSWGADAIYCLGDLGGFGPSPERVRPLLAQGGVRVIQGNYEQSLASGAEDCNCGYADPRDNHFAEISYRYTERHCTEEFKRELGELPAARRILVGERELLAAHGSPRRVNEFLFASTTSTPYLEVLCDRFACDGVVCTHTGLHWHRRLPSGRDALNVGVIGRPANDGRREVWYARLEAGARGQPLGVELVPLRYDWSALAREIRAEGLPEEFALTIETGWWTTCLEVLPAKERARSRY
ncbi:MAG TPA: metallophosphoesterase family protein [Thermoanaerobaculia bacterium]|nr:metallophosphoesterase family protein [Thermoanaerobaculia bacterium]